MRAVLLLLLATCAHAEEFTPPADTVKVIGIKIDEQWQAFVFVTATADLTAAQVEECTHSKACTRLVKKLKNAHKVYIMKF